MTIIGISQFNRSTLKSDAGFALLDCHPLFVQDSCDYPKTGEQHPASRTPAIGALLHGMAIRRRRGGK
jgi:hypothetical protein